MVINEMNAKECAELLSRVSLGRLGCALDSQPYVVPIYFAYDGSYVYMLSTVGQKIEWMRANPKVCLQADEVEGEGRWASVVATGQYEELREPQYTTEVGLARKLLAKHLRWWQISMAERQLKAGDNLIAPMFFRIRVESMSGLRAQ